MMRRRLIILLILIVPFTSWAQKDFPPEKPTLIVKLIIDQFRQDYLFSLRDRFSDGGFKRLINGGSVCYEASYNFSYAGSAPDLATLSTGALPNEHGIIGNYWLERESRTTALCIQDHKAYTLNGLPKKDGYSSSNMLASTLGDQLIMSNFKTSKCITIALDKVNAILGSDHASSGTYWLNENGAIVTSSYYTSWLPNWLDEFNQKQFPQFYCDSQWETLYPLSTYSRNRFEDRMYKAHGFPYNLASIKNKEKNFSFLEHTPMGNMLIKDLAIETINNEALGADEHTDILTLVFSAAAYHKNDPGPRTAETEDIILRLDREIEDILNRLDSTLGQNNYMVVLTSTRGAIQSPKQLEEFNIPSGYFNPDRAVALLNSYLMAIYGQGEWVTGYQSQQVYLNHDLIEKSKILLADFQDKTADFLRQFSGISKAIPSHILNNRAWPNGYLKSIGNAYYASRSGDIFLLFEPGWTEEGNTANELTMGRGTANNKVPLIFYGWKMHKKIVTTPIHICDIAPTLSHMLHIDAPNATNGKLIREVIP